MKSKEVKCKEEDLEECLRKLIGIPKNHESKLEQPKKGSWVFKASGKEYSVTSMFNTLVKTRYEVKALAKAVQISEIPAEYKDLPVIARGNTSIILEKDPKTVIMLTRDAMKKDWLHMGLEITKDFRIHDVQTRNRAFKDIALFSIEMPKLYKPNSANQDKIRKEVSFFEKARNHVGVLKSKENIAMMMVYYEENGMEESLIYHLLNFLTNYYHHQWHWDIARRQFAQDAEGNLILLDPIVNTEVHKAMFTK
jgi:hypothetical protein